MEMYLVNFGEDSMLVTVEIKVFVRNGITRAAMRWLPMEEMDITQTIAPVKKLFFNS